MAGACGAILTAFTPTLVLLVAQEVSDLKFHGMCSWV